MGILIKNNIVNQKGNPAWYESSLATRPIANLQGRMFVDTDTPSTGIYRDNGTGWDQVADPGAGTTGTLQQVTTNGKTTNQGITITAGGLNANNIALNANTGIVKTTAISQVMANNDLWEIYGIGNNASGIGEGELVFSLGDDGRAFATGGERFRFTYDSNIVSGTPKDVFIVDYDLSYFNNNLGINTSTPGTPLDVHGTTGVIAQLENTTTQNTLLSFRNQGAGIWSIGNNYNTGANDYIIYDAASFVNRFTLKSTGQTFIGTDTTSSGLLVVNSATSDNHIVCIGANAPSVRLRNTGTSPTLNAGFGISTATNNFIQSSVSGDYCIFNSSTTASPILFGIYNGTNTQEAARISAARNLIIAYTGSDSGQKLQVRGTSSFNSISCVSNTSYSNHGLVCVPRQDGSTITLSTIFPNVTFSGAAISLQIQILSTDGASTNSSLINCIRTFGTTWSYVLVSTVGTANVLTLTFAGTSAAPTLAITGTLGSISSVLYSIVTL